MRNLFRITSLIIIITGIYIAGCNKQPEIKTKNKINNILEIINEHYIDSIHYHAFENNAINAILNNLDPHSSYISIDDFKSIEEDMQGSFSGIGVEFNIIEDSVVVVSPISSINNKPFFLCLEVRAEE